LKHWHFENLMVDVNPITGNPLYDNIMVNVNKPRRSMVVNDKKDAFNLGDSVFDVPRIKKHQETRG
jgi:hypothetical protein